jgi:hypothetical protein
MTWIQDWWPAVLLVQLGIGLVAFFAIAFWGQKK